MLTDDWYVLVKYTCIRLYLCLFDMGFMTKVKRDKNNNRIQKQKVMVSNGNVSTK